MLPSLSLWTRRAGSTTVLAVLALSAASCSRSANRPYPVQGQVFYLGRPVAEAQVTLYSVGVNPPVTPKPFAYTDAEGRFALTTDHQGDGALPGEYRATVELRAKKLVGEEETRDGRNLLPERFSKPETSGLQCQVVPGSNQLPAWNLGDRNAPR